MGWGAYVWLVMVTIHHNYCVHTPGRIQDKEEAPNGPGERKRRLHIYKI